MSKADAGPDRAMIDLVRDYFPDVQAIYFFGSHGTEDEWPSSDIDMAILLPPTEAKKVGALDMSDLHGALIRLFGKQVDLINLRIVSTVFQKEIIVANRRIYCADEHAADDYEMLTISFFQKLNDERAEIVDAFFRSGRAYVS